VFTSRSYKRLVKSYGLQQEFITPHCPEQNGLVERVIRTIKEQCVQWQQFETLQDASRVNIGRDWLLQPTTTTLGAEDVDTEPSI
jgi:putative transposase